MKHPIDTSAWGEFMVGELFETNGNKTYTGAGIPKNNLEAGSTPRITVTDKNNGIIGSFNDTDNTNYRVYENFISVSFLGTVFWHPYKASVDMKVHVLNKLNGAELTEKRALFLVACIKKTIATFNYAEQLSASKLYKLSIPLPLKPSADPENYSQADIDWTYMETVMSSVTEKTKERLASLPQPTDKKKTPVDTSAWGEFVVGELFDMIQGRRLKKADFVEGDIPYVMASSYNNGVITHISNPITTGQDLLTADIFGNIFYQPSFVGFGDDNCGLKLKNHKATKYQYLFLATVFKQFQNEASFTNKLRGSWYIKQTISLPLKPSADPSDYTQEDIDWDYMERFMQAIKEKAHERVASLKKQI